MKRSILLLILFLSVSLFAQSQYPLVSIRDIQFQPLDSLAAGKDYSPRLGDTVRVIGVVMIPPLDNPNTTRRPIMWAGARWQTYIADTNYNETEWAGLNVIQHDTSAAGQSTYFDLLDTCMVVEITGRVEEFGTNRQTQLAVLLTTPVNVLGQKDFRKNPVLVNVSDFANGTTPKLITGEKYEGMYVEFRNVVTSDANATNGTFAINDAQGNKIFIHDQSGYFTRRSHQLRTWDPPVNGTLLEYIRGVIGTGAQGYVLRPMLPNDYKVGTIIPPAISTVRRDLNTVGPNQPVTITASISDLDGTVAQAKIKYRVNGGPLTEINMSLVSGTTWSGTIPGVQDSALVDFFIWAIDNAGNSSINPVDTSRSRYFYLVLNRPLTIQDIQYAPFGNGLGGYLNYRVTIRGIVTADTSDLRGDGGQVSRRAYIQNGTGPWSGIWVAGLAGDELRKGQDVTISGLIREISSHTAIDSVTQLIVNSTNNPEPKAQLVTTGEIGGKSKGTISAEQWEGVLIKFSNVTVTNTNADGNPGPGGAGNSNFGEVLINDGTGNLRLETQEGPHPYHNNWSTTLPAYKTISLNVGDRFDTVKGILFFSFSNYKIVPRKADDFVGYQTDVEDEILPDRFVLKQNYPNPFNPSTIIEYNLPEASNVTLKIYDLMGREVKTLVNGEYQNKGLYKYFVYSNDLSSGVYFYQLKTDKYSAVKKMILIK
jgi:hypothetical protein